MRRVIVHAELISGSRALIIPPHKTDSKKVISLKMSLGLLLSCPRTRILPTFSSAMAAGNHNTDKKMGNPLFILVVVFVVFVVVAGFHGLRGAGPAM
jgi:hypothetical protein